MSLKNGLKWVWGVVKHILVLQLRISTTLWKRKGVVLVAGKRMLALASRALKFLYRGRRPIARRAKRAYVFALEAAKVFGRITKGVLRRIPVRRLVLLAVFLGVCAALLLGAWALRGRFSEAALSVKRDFALELSGAQAIGATIIGIWAIVILWMAVVFLQGVFAEVGISIQKAEPYPDTGQAGERRKLRLPRIELGWGRLALILLLGYPAVQFVRHIFS